MRHYVLYFDEEQVPESAPATQTAPELKYSDEDLDRIINEKFAKWQKRQAEAVDEAKRLAEMSAQERAEAQRDKLQAELDELKRANARADMEKTARGILQADGVTVPDSVLSVLVTDDAEQTASAVHAFSTAYREAVQAGVTSQLSHKTPTVGIGSGVLTKEDILKEPDPLKRQRLIKENMKLFR